MAESKQTVIVPLNWNNDPTWRVQCRMALVRDGLWGIVAGTETTPAEGGVTDMVVREVRFGDRAVSIARGELSSCFLYEE